MGVFLAGAFFSDKVRAACTLFLLLLILGVGCAQYFFPPTQKLDDETLKGLREVTATMEKTAKSLESGAQSQISLNETLQRQLDETAAIRNKDYEGILKRYGVDISLPSSAPFDASDPFGLRSPDNDIGGGSLPPGEGAANSDRHVQDAAPVDSGKTDPGDPGTPKR